MTDVEEIGRGFFFRNVSGLWGTYLHLMPGPSKTQYVECLTTDTKANSRGSSNSRCICV